MFGVALRAKLSFAPGSWRRQRLLLFCCLPASHPIEVCERPFLQPGSIVLVKVSADCVLPVGAGLHEVLLLNLFSLDIAEFVSSAHWFFFPSYYWLTKLHSSSNHFFLITTFERGNCKGSHCSGFVVAVVWETEGKFKRENGGQRGDCSEAPLEPLNTHWWVWTHLPRNVRAGKENCTCSRCRKENVCVCHPCSWRWLQESCRVASLCLFLHPVFLSQTGSVEGSWEITLDISNHPTILGTTLQTPSARGISTPRPSAASSSWCQKYFCP